MFCQGCGDSIDADHRYCGACGTAQELVGVPLAAPALSIVSTAPALASSPAAAVPEAQLPMYRPDVPDPAPSPAEPRSQARSAVRATAKGIGSVASATHSLFEFVLKWGVTALWALGTVFVFTQGEVVAGLLGGAYVTYLLCGGRWLIW